METFGKGLYSTFHGFFVACINEGLVSAEDIWLTFNWVEFECNFIFRTGDPEDLTLKIRAEKKQKEKKNRRDKITKTDCCGSIFYGEVG